HLHISCVREALASTADRLEPRPRSWVQRDSNAMLAHAENLVRGPLRRLQPLWRGLLGVLVELTELVEHLASRGAELQECLYASQRDSRLSERLPLGGEHVNPHLDVVR